MYNEKTPLIESKRGHSAPSRAPKKTRKREANPSEEGFFGRRADDLGFDMSEDRHEDTRPYEPI